MDKNRIFSTSEVLRLTKTKPNHLEMWIKYGVFKPSVGGPGRRMYSLLDVIILDVLSRLHRYGYGRRILYKISKILTENQFSILDDRDVTILHVGDSIFTSYDVDFDDIALIVPVNIIRENLFDKIKTLDN